MASKNLCIFVGNLGRDPETGVASTGMKVTSFSICVNEKYKQNETQLWLKVVCFDKLAEIVQQYCRKGMAIMVEGRLQVRQYDRQDGTKGTSVEVLARDVQFLERKSTSDVADTAQGQQQPAPTGPDDDDLPF